MQFLVVLSSLLGWIYFFAWSCSFYPQPLLNWRRRSTSGTTIDFPLINCLGFLCYLFSNAAFYFSPVVRAQYAARNHGLQPTVAFNDVAFAFHATILSVITTSQYIPSLWGFSQPQGGGTRPSRFILGVMSGCMTGVVAVLFLIAGSSSASDSVLTRSGKHAAMTATEHPGAWLWIDAVYAVGYVKLLITLIKYTPQILANYRNKSTAGWHIGQILCDFTGGVLSLAQLGIDAYLQRDWSGVTGNPVKLALGNVSMAYDLVFFTQHYWLYRGSGDEKGDGGEDGRGRSREREGLLDGQRRRLD